MLSARRVEIERQLGLEGGARGTGHTALARRAKVPAFNLALTHITALGGECDGTLY